jgi:F0F1-type ATP synthase assembly protein I
VSSELKKLEEKINKRLVEQNKETTKKSNVTVANVAIELFSGVIAGFLVGSFLDYVFKTTPFFLLVMVIFGAISGFYLVYKMIDKDK